MGEPRQACVDCHFLVEERRFNEKYTFILTEEQRARIRARDPEWHGEQATWQCDFLVLEESRIKADDRYSVTLEAERQGACFFWPYDSGMLLPAARVLQERQMARKEADRGLRLTRRSLYVAVAALVVSAALTLLDIIVK